MGQELVTNPDRTASARWREPSLSGRLNALVNQVKPLDVDAIDPLTAAELGEAEAALVVYDAAPRGSTPAAVDRVMARLVVAYPAARLSAAEARARLDIYAELLGDIDADRLMDAADEAVRSLKFFPTVAELREIAKTVPARPRHRRRNRLAMLLRVPPYNLRRAPEQPVIELADPVIIRQMIESAFSKPTPKRPPLRMPTMEEVRAILGIGKEPPGVLTPEEYRDLDREMEAMDQELLDEAADSDSNSAPTAAAGNA